MQWYLILSFAFLFSVGFTYILLSSGRFHGWLSLDTDLSGAQKYHKTPVPRIGGLAIYMTVTIGMLWLTSAEVITVNLNVAILTGGGFTFAIGILEDVLKKVTPTIRIGVMIIGAALFSKILGMSITRLDSFLLDSLLSIWIVSLLITYVAIVGVVNACNIIDGFNGLLTGVAVVVATAMASVAHFVGDVEIFALLILIIGALAGFFVWNYPRGLIFLGDGGAYFIGFMLAALSIVLVERNSSVSPWFPFLLLSYPITETVFSIYRKSFIRKISPTLPDGLHLHMLVYKRIVKCSTIFCLMRFKLGRNSVTSIYMWALSLISVGPSVLFWDNSFALKCFSVGFVSIYIYIYMRIVQLRVPKYLVCR